MADMPKYPRFPPNHPRRIELFAFSQFQMLDVTGPLQVFATANDLAGGDAPRYAIGVVSQDGGGLASSAGVGLLTQGLRMRFLSPAGTYRMMTRPRDCGGAGHVDREAGTVFRGGRGPALLR